MKKHLLAAAAAAGLAIDPVSGNLWIASLSSGTQIIEMTRAGAEVGQLAFTAVYLTRAWSEPATGPPHNFDLT